MTRHPDLIRLNRVLNAVGLLSVAGVLAAVWFFGLRSARRDSEQLAGRQAQLQRFLETETALTSEHESQQVSLERQRTEIELLLTRIPREAREIDFLELLSETAKQTDVTLQNFQPLSGQPGTSIGTSQVRISGRGSYENLIRFLDQLKTMPRMNRVSRLELGVADAARNVCSIELTLELFFNVQSFETSTTAI